MPDSSADPIAARAAESRGTRSDHVGDRPARSRAGRMPRSVRTSVALRPRLVLSGLAKIRIEVAAAQAGAV